MYQPGEEGRFWCSRFQPKTLPNGIAPKWKGKSQAKWPHPKLFWNMCSSYQLGGPVTKQCEIFCTTKNLPPPSRGIRFHVDCVHLDCILSTNVWSSSRKETIKQIVFPLPIPMSCNSECKNQNINNFVHAQTASFSEHFFSSYELKSHCIKKMKYMHKYCGRQAIYYTRSPCIFHRYRHAAGGNDPPMGNYLVVGTYFCIGHKITN